MRVIKKEDWIEIRSDGMARRYGFGGSCWWFRLDKLKEDMD